jgi:hypothetical protein
MVVASIVVQGGDSVNWLGKVGKVNSKIESGGTAGQSRRRCLPWWPYNAVTAEQCDSMSRWHSVPGRTGYPDGSLANALVAHLPVSGWVLSSEDK